MQRIDQLNNQIAQLGSPVLRKLLSDLHLSQETEENLNSQSIVINESLKTSHLIDISLRSNVFHFIYPVSPSTMTNLALSAALQKCPHDLIENPSDFIAKIAKEIQPEFYQREYKNFFRSTNDKEQILREVEEFVGASANTRSHILRAIIIIDELISNALIHGPRTSNGDRIFHRDQLSTGIVHPDHLEPSQVFALETDTTLILGCKDRFGSLTKDIFSRSLKKCFNFTDENDWNKICIHELGGLGMRMMLDNCSSFSAAVVEKVCTLFFCTIPSRTSGVQVESIPKSMNLVFLPGLRNGK